jgi:NAD(P)-dependent dehydrogenase (short-subunit alcohol dehydrogenase family)
MDLELRGCSVLVIGASKGIGLALAESFAREGANVIITGRDPTRLSSALSSKVATFVGDLGVNGGGYGISGEFYPKDFLIPFIARKLKRPICWIEDRNEHLNPRITHRSSGTVYASVPAGIAASSLSTTCCST